MNSPFAAPSGPPLGLSAVAQDSRTLELSWGPPAEENRNGIVRKYNITVLTRDGDGETRSITTMQTRETVPNLHPHYTYVCTVLAITVSAGPSASVSAQLPEDSECDKTFPSTNDMASYNQPPNVDTFGTQKEHVIILGNKQCPD